MASLRELMKKHWGISTVLIGCLILGIILGLMLLPDTWHTLRKIVGGGLGGSVCGLFIVAHRLIEGAGEQALAEEDHEENKASKSSQSSAQEP